MSAEPASDIASLEREREKLLKEFKSPVSVPELTVPKEMGKSPALRSLRDHHPAEGKSPTVPTLPEVRASGEATLDAASLEQEREKLLKEFKSPALAVPELTVPQEKGKSPAPGGLGDHHPGEGESLTIPALPEVQASAEPMPGTASLEREEFVKEFKSPMVPPAEIIKPPALSSLEDHHPAEEEAPTVPMLPEVHASAEPTPDAASLQQVREELLKEFESAMFLAPEELGNSPTPSSMEDHHPGEEEPATTLKTGYDPLQRSVDVRESAPHADLNEAAKPLYDAELSSDLALQKLRAVSEHRLSEAPDAFSPVTGPEEGSIAERETRRIESAVFHPEPASPKVGRKLDVVTVVLGVVVLACAVLLSVLVGLRLSGRNPVAEFAHKAKSASGTALKTPDQNTSPANASPPPTGATGNATSDSLPAAGTSPMSGSNVGAPAAPSEGRAAAASPPAGTHPIRENRKEALPTVPSAPVEKQSAKGTEAQRSSPVWPARTIRLSADAAESSLLHRVEPDYPEEARRREIQGPVVLDLHIGKDGTVQDVGLVSGQAALVGAATSAVRQWRFKPHLVDGSAVDTQTRITLSFTLPPR